MNDEGRCLRRLAHEASGRPRGAAVVTTMTLPESGYDVLALDPYFEGHCPCATVVIDDVRLELHCWRVCDQCEYVGVHYEGSEGRALAERVKPLLDEMDWYGEWELREGFRRHTA